MDVYTVIRGGRGFWDEDRSKLGTSMRGKMKVEGKKAEQLFLSCGWHYISSSSWLARLFLSCGWHLCYVSNCGWLLALL